MVTASASVYPRRSKRLLHARVKKPKHKYACHTNPKKKHPIPYGTGFLFTQSDNNTGRCVRTELKTRSITAEELIMNESTFSFIDSNCLHDAFSSRGTTSSSNKTNKKSKGDDSESRKKYPLCAISINNELTWQLVVMLHVHPQRVLYSHAHYDANGNLIISNDIKSKNIVDMSTKEPVVVSVTDENNLKVTYNTFSVHYLNRITSSSNCSVDGYIQCSPNGPDRDHDVSPLHIQAVKDAISTDTPIIDKKGLHLTLRNIKGTKDETLAKPGRETVFCNYHDTTGQSGCVVALPPIDIQGKQTIGNLYFLSPFNVSALLKKGDNDEGKVPIETFKNFLQDNSTLTEKMHISKVPLAGLIMETTAVSDKIGTIDNRYSSLLEPSDREGIVAAEWVKGSPSSSWEMDLFSFMCRFTYGTSASSSEQRRVTWCGGFNHYSGRNTSSRRRPTPRNGRAILLQIERWRQSPIRNTLFIPIIAYHTNILTVETNRIAKASDSVLFKFTRGVLAQSVHGNEVLCRNNPGSQFNGLKLITGANEKVRGYLCEKHNDKNDDFSKQFSNVGKNIINNTLQNCLEDNPNIKVKKALNQVKDSVHLLRLGYRANGTYKWSLRATCGYHAKYIGENDRKVCALFVYNGINQAVQIPINKVAYQSWDTSIDHQTSMPYTYGEYLLFSNP